jgi:hypothetical protein
MPNSPDMHSAMNFTRSSIIQLAFHATAGYLLP